MGRADLARAVREGPKRVLCRVLLGQDLARPDAAADARVADGDVAGSSTVGSAVRSLFRKSRAEASRELIKYNRIAADILKHWDVVRGEWVPLLPFAMKIGSDLYHPAHGGDERARSGSYTRAVNGCFDPTAGGEKKE